MATLRLLLAGSAASVICWYLPGAEMIVYPLRLFVTLVHEIAHALAAVLTGGVVEGIVVAPSGNGLTTTMGGQTLLIYPAGYVGTTAVGAALLLATGRQPGARLLMLVVSLLATAGILWIRDPFTVVVTAMLAIALFLVARRAGGRVADFVAAFLAVQLCLNAVLDLRTLIWLTAGDHRMNDAVLMSEAYGLSPWFWAILWSALSLAILYAALRAACSPRRS